jgi:hypothetical protein
MKSLMIAALAAVLPVHIALAGGNVPAPSELSEAGQKIDSGLGELPHYRFWADRSGKQVLVGQSLDSGLGELPHYRYWAQSSGESIVVGQKLDSGLGELPPYRLWVDTSGRNPVASAPAPESISVARLK